MKRKFIVTLCVIITICVLPGWALGAGKVLKMSTTTSTQASGLLDFILPEFEKDTGITVKVLAKGTGAAIRDGIDGNVDVIFVHAKAREEKFIADGYGTQRYAVMHNDFIILGPQKDPAGIKGMRNAAGALNKIAAAKALFVSRGDDSGTHTKEQALWKTTGLDLDVKASTIVKKGKKITVSFVQPKGSGKWYLSIGQGMGKTITFADEKKAYTLADRGTYIKYKHGRDSGLNLEIMCEGDPVLNNPYGVIPIDPKKRPHVQYDLAEQFAKWLVSSRGQSLISNYKLLGKQLFYPDAVK
ncbi:MAG: tungsten ABC transporter substrate-binding protein [Desulfobacterales bacterium PC51MH44]|nr:MAG: tungsten ABC transporter substrate-binding protein [Desulfobacterales bacterium PC51MH44]